MRKLKIGVVGAGSTYTPELIDGFIKRQKEMAVKEFALMDINEERLKIVGGLTKRMCAQFTNPPEVIFTTNLDEAVTDADYIVTQFRVGGFAARAKDEKIPLGYDIIGQETTGPGGFTKALRTIPEALKVAKSMELLAPKAWLINFTNPSGIVTEAISKYSSVKVVGLCNAPITHRNRIAEVMEVTPDEIYIDSFGLNHLGWIRGIDINGEDKTQEFFKKIMDSPRIDYMLGYKFNRKYIKALNLLPTGYLQYYYYNREVLKKLQSLERTRAQIIMDIDKELLLQYSDPNLKVKPVGIEKRGGAWYSEAAVALINSIENNKKEIHIVNVRNNGAIAGIDDDAIVEVPVVVGSAILKPLVVGKIPDSVAGLIKHVKAYESLTVKAGAERLKDVAFMALVNHPFITSIDEAEKMFEELLAANKDYIHLT
ncbi:6-phospho-beta-glucosidase [Candidatus Atribacteria bacterium HGW-Atribacteria-1]|nr:MAG: 6-phospho-beta-glucosidase [Candidatus Atribacteria bacterium HGW-Atribacteria-1]